MYETSYDRSAFQNGCFSSLAKRSGERCSVLCQGRRREWAQAVAYQSTHNASVRETSSRPHAAYTFTAVGTPSAL